MIRAKYYETVSKFVKVMTKILWPLFFPDTVYYSSFLSTLSVSVYCFALSTVSV